MNNAIDFNEEEQIKKDIERARRNVNNSQSETKPSRQKGEVFEEEDEPITKLSTTLTLSLFL